MRSNKKNTRLSECSLVRLSAAVATLLGLAGASHALTFNFIDPGNMQGNNPAAYNGFVQAGNRWSSLFTDNVTINFQIGFASLSPGTLAQAGSVDASYAYSSVRNALIADASSSLDSLAIANLPNVEGGNALNMMTNYTANNPNGAASMKPYLDANSGANNMSIYMSNANAKALGLLAGNAAGNDANLTFNSDFTFDFDPSDGITGDGYDFIGIATHEIGHALGFVSGVDDLDFSGGTFTDDQLANVSTLDLFRRSDLSLLNGGANTIDWTAGGNAYFSVDGGTTNLGYFSTGRTLGDGQQASHWKDNLGLGTMDPTAGENELLTLTQLDINAFDAIGWTLKPTAAPEPGSLALIGLVALPGAVALRRRRK